MKPACAPQLSITWPTATAPAATPAAKPVELHAKASVRRLLVNRRLKTPTDVIRVGAIAIPLRLSNRANADRMVDQGEWQQRQRQQGRAYAKRWAGEARQMIAPVTAPATSDPNDHATKSGRRREARPPLLGERDDVDLHAAKDHAESAGGDRNGHEDSPRQPTSIYAPAASTGSAAG